MPQQNEIKVLLNGAEAASVVIPGVSLEEHSKVLEELEQLREVYEKLVTAMDAIDKASDQFDQASDQTDGTGESEEFEPDYVVSPGADITTVLRMANSMPGKSADNKARVLLEAGEHVPFDVSDIDNVHILFETGAVVEGMVQVPEITWGPYGLILEGNYPGFEQLWLWQSNHENAAYNNSLMYPLLCTIEDEPLLWNPTGRDALKPGEFWVDSSPDRAGKIYVHLKAGQDIKDFKLSPYWRLMWGNVNTKGIVLENAYFHGCSNPGKTGAVNFPGSQWDVRGCYIDLVNTIGAELGQGGDRAQMRGQVIDSAFDRLVVTRAGQQSIWGGALDTVFTDCGHEYSNWKGFDTWWEASIKFENMHGCVFIRFFARHCEGPGIWLDGVFNEDGGGNTGNRFEDCIIDDCVRVGFEIELGSSNNDIINCTISNIRHRQFHPEKPWNVRDAFIIKAFSNSNTITGGRISGVEYLLRLQNNDTRGQSSGNKISGYVANDYFEKFNVEGDVLDNQLL